MSHGRYGFMIYEFLGLWPSRLDSYLPVVHITDDVAMHPLAAWAKPLRISALNLDILTDTSGPKANREQCEQ